MIVQVIDKLFLVYFVMLFIRILSSWLPEFQQTRVMRFIAFYTDPYLNIFRKLIPPLGMMDLSPIVAFLFLNFLEYVLKSFVLML
ncbi:MAG: YggT family protein [Parachlamydiaceae bacterium]|nr:YggT family protein [Parachlamydiaceae bacterium]